MKRAPKGFSLPLDGEPNKTETKLRKELAGALKDADKARNPTEAATADQRIRGIRAQLAREHGTIVRKGRNRTIKSGHFYPDDDPAVLAHPDKFEDADEWVERATAAPGELRVNKPRTYDTVIMGAKK